MGRQTRLSTQRRTIGQVLVCTGCCCGRVDRGKPPVPVDWLKTEWKRLGMLKTIQLTISGCLGPCDLVNVVSIVGPSGTTWIGGLDCQSHFEALRDWAAESVRNERMADLPPILAARIFERFR